MQDWTKWWQILFPTLLLLHIPSVRADSERDQASLPSDDMLALPVGGSSKFKRKELPPEPRLDHKQNGVLDLGPLYQSMLLPISSVAPVRLEAVYNEPVSLEGVLRHALKHSFAIGIARESWLIYRWGLYSSAANYLPIPSNSLNWSMSKSEIAPDQIASNSRNVSDYQGYSLFTGGSAFNSFLSQYYSVRGWKHDYFGSINDTLLSVYNAYTNLRLNSALLQIAARSLKVSESQMKVNDALFTAGTGTRFAIMQSRSQLAADRQALLAQQVATRQAALSLAYALNAPLSVNLIPCDESLSEDEIMDVSLSLDQLMEIALKNRPDLRSSELYLTASRRNIVSTASSLYPSVSLSTGAGHSSTTTYQSTESKNNALLQQAIVFNQNKLASQSGSSGSSTGSSTSTGSSSLASEHNAGVYGGLSNTLSEGYNLYWALPTMGIATSCYVASWRALSTQAMLQANQKLLSAQQSIHNAYLNAVCARDRIDSSAYGVASAQEQLRLALLRLQSGTGTNLELITAQREYIKSLTAQAKAICDSNLAQAQLLHDTGLISLDTLTGGYFPNRPFRQPRKGK